MPLYIAVVQLENAGEDDYAKLTLSLEERAFHTTSYTVRDRTDEFQSLVATKTGTMRAVIDEVKNAAAETGKIFSFTVMKNKR